MKHTHQAKDGQEVKHQDHFCCRRTCRFCGKRRHYEDECHFKRCESEKHKKAEEKRRKTAGKGGGADRGGLTLDVLRVRVTLEDEGPQPPPLLEEKPPNPHIRLSSRVKSGQPLPSPALVAPTRATRTPRSAA